MGSRANQNGRNQRAPVVLSQRTVVTVLSKDALVVSMPDSVWQERHSLGSACVVPRTEGQCVYIGGGGRTHLLQLLQHLVVLPAQLRPLCELVLAARSIQVAPHIQVGLLQLALLADLGRGSRRG